MLWLHLTTNQLIGYAAIDQIFRVINEQSQASFDEDFNFISYYNWTGGNGALSPQVDNGGNGEPKAYTGPTLCNHDLGCADCFLTQGLLARIIDQVTTSAFSVWTCTAWQKVGADWIVR